MNQFGSAQALEESRATKARRPDRRRALGRQGEELAAATLEAEGYRVLARNWYSRYGELDLVVARGDWVVAVEVKTRSNLEHGHPLEAITPSQVRRLRRLLVEWVAKNRPRGDRLRIDAVSVLLPPGREPLIDHLRNIT